LFVVTIIGPDTHYKVLQVVAAGLRISLSREDLEHGENMLVWGYRNVWFVFPPSQATLMIPCSASDLDLMHDTFMSCFTTQKNVSFPLPFPSSSLFSDQTPSHRTLIGFFPISIL
jgi:hypothetical protein